MTVELKDLKIKDLKQFTYEQLLDVIDQLEQICMTGPNSIDILDNFGDYRTFSYTISQILRSGKFDESLDESEKARTLSRTDFLNIYFYTIASVHSISGESNEAMLAQKQQNMEDLQEQRKIFSTQLDDTQKNILNQITEQNEAFSKQIDESTKQTIARFGKERLEIKAAVDKDIDEKLKDSEKAISEKFDQQKNEFSQLERTTVSHVLSLMGIFSAIITIIMSVVLTTTAWLNNANGASAILAFIVPNLVTLFAVSVMLSLIYLYTHRHGEKIFKTPIIYIVIGIIVIIGILLGSYILLSLLETICYQLCK